MQRTANQWRKLRPSYILDRLMSKKIVMVGNTAWSMFQFRADTISSFIELGYQVIVIAPHDNSAHKIQKMGARFVPIKLDRKGANPLSDIKFIIDLILILRKIKPSIICCYTIKPALYGAFASWTLRIPQRVSITTGLGYTFSHKNAVSWIARFLYKIFLKFSTEVWFLNRNDMDTFLENKLVSPMKVFLLPSEGVNTQYYISKNKKFNLTFTLISRMLWDKGIGVFVDSVKKIKEKIPDAKFVIIGPIDKGNPEAIPLELLQKWDQEGFVKYLGPKDDIREFLQDTDCLVHPTFYKEGIPRILLEANSMSIPCITTDIPGCRDAIKDGKNGFLVKPKDLSSLSDAILKYAGLSLEEKEYLSQTAREYVIENFSSEIVNAVYKERLNL